MTEKKTKRIVQVFSQPDWVSNLSCSSDDCGCEASCCGPTENLDDVLARFSANYGDRGEVSMADYSTDSAVSESIDALNRILETSQETFRVKRDNFELFMSQAAPLIVIDGIIAFIRGVPSAEQLARALEIVPEPAA